MENLNKDDTKELTKEQRLFVALLKEKGLKYHELSAKFTEKWPNRAPPTRNTVYLICKKLHNHHTLDNRRVGLVGRPRSVRTPDNIKTVKDALEA